MHNSYPAVLSFLFSLQLLVVFAPATAQEYSPLERTSLATQELPNPASQEEYGGDLEPPRNDVLPQALLQAGSCATLADEIFREGSNCRSLTTPTDGYPLHPDGGSCGDCYWGFVALVKACGLPLTQQTCNDNLATFCGIPSGVTTRCRGWRLSNPPVAQCWCNAWPR